MKRPNGEQLGEWLSAYVDGELDEEQTATIEAILREDDAARRMLHDLHGAVAVMRSLPQHPAPSSIAEDIQLYVERSQLLGEVEDVDVRAPRRRNPMWGVLSTAAVLMLVVGGAWYLSDMYRHGTLGLRVADDSTATPDATTLADATKPHSAIDRAKAEAAAERENSAAALLASANLDQKLAAGWGWEAVADHAFDNEPYRLQVNVRTAAQRDAITARLTRYLSKQRLVDAGATDSPLRSASTAPAHFFYRGNKKSNFAATNERQVLLRTSVGELQAVVDELNVAAPRKWQIAFVTGPVRIVSREGIRGALQGIAPGELAPSSDVDDALAEGRLTGARELDRPATSDGYLGPLGGLMRAMGLDAEELSALQPLVDDVASPVEDEGRDVAEATDVLASATAPAGAEEALVDAQEKSSGGGGATAKSSTTAGSQLSSKAGKMLTKKKSERDRMAEAGDAPQGDVEQTKSTAAESADEGLPESPSLVESRLRAAREARLRVAQRPLATRPDVRGRRGRKSTRTISKTLEEPPESLPKGTFATLDPIGSAGRPITVVIQIIAAEPERPRPQKKTRSKPPSKKRDNLKG